MTALNYLDQVGPPPPAWTYAWRSWYYARLNYLINYCNRPRATTYYISNSTGADSNAGTQTAPWKTLAKAQSMMAVNTAFLFAAGDEWNETVGLLPAAYVTIGRYGNGANPFFNAFAGKITSGWTLTAGTTWQVSAVPNVAQFRLTGRAQPQLLTGLSPYFTSSLDAAKFVLWPMSTLAACEANIGTWYFDATNHIIYFNTGNSGTAPPSCEYSIAGLLSGVDVNNVDGVYVRGIRADGWGASGVGGAGGNSEQMPFASALSSAQVCCFDGCEAFYSDAHLIGMVQGAATPGGIFVTRNCRMGLAAMSASGSVPLISYNQAGGQETFHESPILECGAIPIAGASIPANGYFAQGNAVLAHTSGGTAYTSVFACRGLRLLQQSHSLSVDNSSNDVPPPDSGNAANSLVFFVDTESEKLPAGVPGPIGITPLTQGAPNAIFVNCRWHDQFYPAGNGYQSTDVPYMGHMVNCDITLENVSPTVCYFIEAANPGSTALDVHFSRFAFKGYWGGHGHLFQYGTNILIDNSDFVNQTSATEVVASSGNYGTGIITMEGNCYTPGAFLGMNDAHAISAGSIHFDGEIPSTGSVLLRAATMGISGGIYPEFDINWNPRNPTAPSVGPYEVNPGLPSGIAASTVPFILSLAGWPGGTPNAQLYDSTNTTAQGSAITTGFTVNGSVVTYTGTKVTGQNGFLWIYEAGTPSAPVAIIPLTSAQDVAGGYAISTNVAEWNKTAVTTGVPGSNAGDSPNAITAQGGVATLETRLPSVVSFDAAGYVKANAEVLPNPAPTGYGATISGAITANVTQVNGLPITGNNLSIQVTSPLIDGDLTIVEGDAYSSAAGNAPIVFTIDSFAGTDISGATATFSVTDLADYNSAAPGDEVTPASIGTVVLALSGTTLTATLSLASADTAKLIDTTPGAMPTGAAYKYRVFYTDSASNVTTLAIGVLTVIRKC